MHRHIQSVFLALFIFALVLPHAVRAQPIYDSEPLPPDGIITQPGRYHLESDLIVSRDICISIQADDVTLDLNGHALRFADTPREGTFGVIASGRSIIRITNGAIGGFWFNINIGQSQGLQIDNMDFDDTPYLTINVATAQDVLITNNTFTNFRYDIPKTVDNYVIGVNIGAGDAVVTRNRFDAQYTGDTPNNPGIETVFVLFSADVSRRSVVSHNEMTLNTTLDRSYGLWVASNAHVTAMHNTIRNTRYGITLATNATALSGYNSFISDPPLPGVAPLSTYGIWAFRAEQVFVTGSEYQDVSNPTLLPPDLSDDWDNSDMVLALEINDLSTAQLPGAGYDQIDLPGAFTHGGSIRIDVANLVLPGAATSLKMVGWTSQVGSSASTSVSFIGGDALGFHFSATGLYVDIPGGGVMGDLDGDGFVGITDLNIVLANWNQNVPPANSAADPSGDGFVGIADLNVVLGNWNAGTPPVSNSNIPEPASLALLLIGGLMIPRRPTT